MRDQATMSKVEIAEAPRRRGRRLERILGGSPAGVAVQLLVLSLGVGVILSALDIRPSDLLAWFDVRLDVLLSSGLRLIRHAWGTFALGAALVLPAYVLWRLVRLARREP